jgi:predicted NAD-dependent protein-ADP-ribosyltransferase YbiA (DUF1768 family)
MAASRFVEVTDKQISEIKINSVPKNTKDLCVKILKQLLQTWNSEVLKRTHFITGLFG